MKGWNIIWSSIVGLGASAIMYTHYKDNFNLYLVVMLGLIYANSLRIKGD